MLDNTDQQENWVIYFKLILGQFLLRFRIIPQLFQSCHIHSLRCSLLKRDMVDTFFENVGLKAKSLFFYCLKSTMEKYNA